MRAILQESCRRIFCDVLGSAGRIVATHLISCMENHENRSATSDFNEDFIFELD